MNTGVSVTWVQSALLSYTPWKWRLTPSSGGMSVCFLVYTLLMHYERAGQDAHSCRHTVDGQWSRWWFGCKMAWWFTMRRRKWCGRGIPHFSHFLLCCPSSTDNTQYWWTSNTTASQIHNKEANRSILNKYKVYIQSIQCCSYERSAAIFLVHTGNK